MRQRFVAIGSVRVNFVQAAWHDQQEAAAMVAHLESSRPTRILLDIDRKTWDKARRRPAWMQPLDAVGYDFAMRSGGSCRPNAVMHAVRTWAAKNQVPVAPLVTRLPRLRRKAVRKLTKIADTEAMPRGGGRQAMEAWLKGPVRQVPDAWEWMQKRYRIVAANLVAHFRGRGEPALCIFQYPYADPVADKVAKLAPRMGAAPKRP